MLLKYSDISGTFDSGFGEDIVEQSRTKNKDIGAEVLKDLGKG